MVFRGMNAKFATGCDSRNRVRLMQLKEVLGVERFHKMMKLFAGRTLHIPKRGMLVPKWQLIVEMWNAGRTFKQIVIFSGSSSNYVYQILRRRRHLLTSKF